MRHIALSTTLTAALLLSACGGGGGDSETTTGTTEFVLFPEYVTPEDVVECSVEDIKRRIDWDMRDYYVYYDQVPQVNLADYDSGSELIRALRVEPDTYSYVSESSTQSALYDEGETAGHGLTFRPAGDGVVRFREIQEGSPAHRAGLLRGDEVVTVDGRAPQDISDAEFRELFLPENSPIVMTVRTGEEDPRSVSVEHEVYRWVTAGREWLFTSTSNPSLPKVGYLSIRSFLETTKDEIDSALDSIKATGVAEEFIVDLRYNSGGRTSVARYLGARIGGAAVEGKVITETKWNDKYASLDSAEIFESVSEPLNMARVFVLTTGRTASASEIFINSLKPYIEVIVVGDVTSGKPFTSSGREYCGQTINAMRSVRTNSVGVSVLGGIEPDCYVNDNWESPLRSTRDPLVSAALGVVKGGTCNIVAADGLSMQRSAVVSGPIYEPEDPTMFLPSEN